MSETRRDRFLQRISTVGGGTRDAIQMGLGSIVCDVRDMVERGVFAEEELDGVIRFHDHAEEFWRHAMATAPPMDPMLMVAGLRQLRALCSQPLTGFALRLDQMIEKAETFAARKRN